VKRGGLLSFLVGTIGNVLVMEIGWTDVGSGDHRSVRPNYMYTFALIIKKYFNEHKGYLILKLVLLCIGLDMTENRIFTLCRMIT
jgi:hypothetical protein